MCGLFGWFVNDTVNTSRLGIVGAVLGIANTTRGRDSWGVYADGELTKGLGPISETRLGDLFADRRLVVAHTRARTVGVISPRNAHPFDVSGDHGRVIGAHNGIIENHYGLNTRFSRSCEVDSEHIFQHIAEGKDLDDLTGYGAVTWIHERTNDTRRLYFSRFNGGVLTVMKIPGGIVWSSTESDLRHAIKASGLIESGRGYVVYVVKDGRVYEGDPATGLSKVGRFTVRGHGSTRGSVADWWKGKDRDRGGSSTTTATSRFHSYDPTTRITIIYDKTGKKTYWQQGYQVKEEEYLRLTAGTRATDTTDTTGTTPPPALQLVAPVVSTELVAPANDADDDPDTTTPNPARVWTPCDTCHRRGCGGECQGYGV